MFWIFLLLIGLMVFGLYAMYKEAKHHELHKMRAGFEDRRAQIRDLMTSAAAKTDNELEEFFKGELRGIEETLETIDKEDADCDLIQEIEDDLAALKKKMTSLFKKKEK